MSRLRRVFVSYRRNDTQGHVRSLAQDLRAVYREAGVYRDTDYRDADGDGPPPSIRDAIAAELGSCAVILIVIGPDWTSLTRAGSSVPRLHEDDDIVRFEVEHALKERDRGACVLTVLVGRAALPHADDVPESMWELFDQSAAGRQEERIELRPDPYWPADLELLKARVAPCMDRARPVRRWKDFVAAMHATAVLMAAALGGFTVARWTVPLLSPDTWLLGVILGVCAAAALVLAWLGYRLLPERLWQRSRSGLGAAGVWVSLPILILLYRTPQLIVLREIPAESDAKACDRDVSVMEFARSWPRGHNRPLAPIQTCQDFHASAHTRVELRLAASPSSGRLEIATEDETGAIDAVVTPRGNENDVRLSDDESAQGASKAAKEWLRLGLANGDDLANFVCLFRVESSFDTVAVTVTLWSPLGFPVAQETAHVSTVLLPTRPPGQ